jgi:uncharacterized protein YciI
MCAETGRLLARETYSPVNMASTSSSDASQQGAGATSSNKQYYVIFAMDRPGGLELRMKTREAHLAFIKKQIGVKLAGPVMRSEDGAMCGSMLIVHGSRQDVDAMCAADPYFVSGLFDSTRVQEWKWVIGTSKQDSAQAADNLCVLECRDKPNSLEVRKANREQHLEYLKHNADNVISAGPLIGDDGGMCGSVIIVKGTETDARAFANNDPYAAAGLFANVSIKRWKKVIDNRD